MNKVPDYLIKTVEALHGCRETVCEKYSVEWLNKWLNKEELAKKYGEEWETSPILLANHNQAKGYMEAIGYIYLRKMKKLPEITGEEIEILSQEVTHSVDEALKNAIHRFCQQHGNREEQVRDDNNESEVWVIILAIILIVASGIAFFNDLFYTN